MNCPRLTFRTSTLKACLWHEVIWKVSGCDESQEVQMKCQQFVKDRSRKKSVDKSTQWKTKSISFSRAGLLFWNVKGQEKNEGGRHHSISLMLQKNFSRAFHLCIVCLHPKTKELLDTGHSFTLVCRIRGLRVAKQPTLSGKKPGPEKRKWGTSVSLGAGTENLPVTN